MPMFALFQGGGGWECVNPNDFSAESPPVHLPTTGISAHRRIPPNS